MPPSSDDLPGRKPPRKQRRAQERAERRKRGKQPGAPGSAMSWAEPDDVRDHYPQGVCECGADLADAADLGVARSLQQTEIPGPSAQRIQHDLHLAVCSCGREHVAPRPPGVPDAAVSIGPWVRALAVYLVVFQHTPVERCRGLIADVTGAEVSAGFVHSCLRAAADLSAEVVKLIRTLITAARVDHAALVVPRDALVVVLAAVEECAADHRRGTDLAADLMSAVADLGAALALAAASRGTTNETRTEPRRTRER
jgi:transposase